MGFVKTPDEIVRIEHALKHPRFVNAEMLSVSFLTDAAFARSVLPPGLELRGEPVMTASVGRWQSNCVADFDGGSLTIPARHGEHEAEYVLAMYMTSDHAIVYGRELFGEPKKQATVAMHRKGGRFTGHIGRLGTRLIEIDADLGPDEGPASARTFNFNFKAPPATNGVGLEWDPLLTLATFDLDIRVQRTGTGRLTLRSGLLDPLGDIPVLETRGAAYVEGDIVASARAIATVPADAFLPYAYGRVDDWSLLDTERLGVNA